jgi:hypothetical protein
MAPGSKVVTEYYEKAGLWPYLEKLGYHLVGYGCTTCIGNSGPLVGGDLRGGQRQRPHRGVGALGQPQLRGPHQPDVKMNYLASPPLVIAYALAGTMDFDFAEQPLGTGSDGRRCTCRTSGRRPPTVQSVDRRDDQRGHVRRRATPTSSPVTSGGARCRRPEGSTFEWDPESTYVRKPPYFDGHGHRAGAGAGHRRRPGARRARRLRDHRPHLARGSIKADTPAGQYLTEHGVDKRDFNSYGSRRGNHEVMIRGTFANIRLRNLLLDGVSGGYTRDFTQDGGPQAFIYDAAQNYAEAGTPLVVLGGKEYGSGSSRDWAAKGTALLGVKAVIVESYERIHRSNLIGMGVLPLQFPTARRPTRSGWTAPRRSRSPGSPRSTTAPPAHRARERDQGIGRDRRVRRAGAHRHPRRGRLLPQRRHHAVRACGACAAAFGAPVGVDRPPARTCRRLVGGTLGVNGCVDARGVWKIGGEPVEDGSAGRCSNRPSSIRFVALGDQAREVRVAAVPGDLPQLVLVRRTHSSPVSRWRRPAAASLSRLTATPRTNVKRVRWTSNARRRRARPSRAPSSIHSV